MQIALRFGAALVVAFILGGSASAQIATSKGTASVQYGNAVTPEIRDAALRDAKLNALERYIAESNPAKQRLFDSARDRLLASLDSFILSTTPLSETADPGSKTYSVVVRVEVNTGRFENALADASGTAPARAGGAQVAAIFVSRAPQSVQSFDDRVYKREDSSVKGGVTSDGRRTTRESESISGSAVGTGDRVNARGSFSDSSSSVTETGGSVTRKADKLIWSVANSGNVDQEMTGVFANAGLEIVPAEFITNLDLGAVRKDFGGGDDLSPATLRGMVAAVRASGITYLTLGSMDEELPDQDPVSGNVRIYVTVNAKVYDLSRPIPRVLSAIGPIQYAGLGPTPAVAKTNALKLAADEVARKLVDEITVKGVR
jgi:hypothetical protein